MKLITEETYPVVTGGVVSIVCAIFGCDYRFPSSLCNLFSAAITISAIAIGFIATSKAILLSIDNRRVVKFIKGVEGLYAMLIDYMMSSIHLCFISAIISAIGLLIDIKTQPSWLLIFFPFWLFFGITSLLACYRVIHIFTKILKSAGNLK